LSDGVEASVKSVRAESGGANQLGAPTDLPQDAYGEASVKSVRAESGGANQLGAPTDLPQDAYGGDPMSA